jgi:hypothetical protein
MKTNQKIKVSIGVLFCLLSLALISNVQANTDHFTNSVVMIVGKTDSVTTPAWWLFGCKLIFDKQVIIQANGGDGEKINALILPSKIGFYFGQENIYIQMEGAKGLFFWGEKSLLFHNVPPRIFAFCKADDIWVTY